MLEDRRFAVLRAIVEDYVATHEPVGSKALVERHGLGVSPATVRNDMAALEEEGFIAQPHTSAGRIPTERGYRVFVDRLSAVRPLSSAERKAIHSFLGEAVDIDDAVTRSVRLLSQLTRQVALVQYPSLSRSSVRHIEVVYMTPTRALLVLISDTGRVEQRIVDLPGPVGEEVLAELRARLLTAVIGHRLAEVPGILENFTEALAAEDRPLAAAIVATMLEMVIERPEERVVVGGASHLARYGETFHLQIQPLLEALEEQVVLLRLLGEATSSEQVTVRIGRENPEGLESTSIVTAGYSRGDEVMARLGVVGPTHMDYPSSMASVRAVAQYLSRILSEQ